MITKKDNGKYYDSYTNDEYDSLDEIYFAWYLHNLHEAKIVLKWVHHKKNVELIEPVKHFYLEQLKTKTKLKTKTLLSNLSYTGDFSILWNKSAKGIFYNNICTDPEKAEVINPKLYFLANHIDITHVDVKNPFNFKNMRKRFSILQKIIYTIRGQYVQTVEVKALFSQTFVPVRYLKTDSGKSDRRGLSPVTTRTLNEYIDARSKN